MTGSHTSVILTTEKDAQRLLSCGNLGEEVSRRLFYLPVEMVFLNWDYYFQFKAQMLSIIKPSKPAKGVPTETEAATEEEKPDFLKPMEPVNGGLLF